MQAFGERENEPVCVLSEVDRQASAAAGESCEDNAGTDNMNIIPIYVICITRQGSILLIRLV